MSKKQFNVYLGIATIAKIKERCNILKLSASEYLTRLVNTAPESPTYNDETGAEPEPMTEPEPGTVCPLIDTSNLEQEFKDDNQALKEINAKADKLGLSFMMGSKK